MKTVSTSLLSAVSGLNLLRILAVVVAVCCIGLTAGLENHVARTPVLGWSTKLAYGCNYNETTVHQLAAALKDSGLAAAGFNLIVLDDCLIVDRTDDGSPVVDSTRFPRGLDYAIGLTNLQGVSVGLTLDIGTVTCEGYVGSMGNEEDDVDTFTLWGAQMLQMTDCGDSVPSSKYHFQEITQYILDTGEKTVVALNNNGSSASPQWGNALSNMWRTSLPIDYPDGYSWNNILRNFDANSFYVNYAGPGGWNDPGLLVIGLPGVAFNIGQAQYLMWTISAAPLILTYDLLSPNVDPAVLQLLTNPELIQVNQDPLGKQGVKVYDDGAGRQVWAKPLEKIPGASSYHVAVALVNRSPNNGVVFVSWDEIGIPSSAKASVRDLVGRTLLGTFAVSFSQAVPAFSASMFRVWVEQSGG